MFKIRHIWFCVLLASALATQAATTNSLAWHKSADRVDADVSNLKLWPFLEKLAVVAEWKIFVEPGAERNVSAKFKDLPSGEALKMLLGDLNFALVPQTNGPAILYVFRTTMQNATRRVVINKPAKRIANELLIRVKPGTDIEALAKMLGAKIVGRLDKLGLYRLQFADAAATDAALGQLQANSDVAQVDYNYSFDPPPSTVPLANAPGGPISLTLNPPGDSGKVIVGLIDQNVQSLGTSLDKFILPEQSVAGDSPASTVMTHGTAMAYTILEAIAQQSASGASSVQIQPVDVYGGNETTTSWYVALGIQKAVDSGANVLNMSLGSAGDSSVLDGVVKLALADNIVMFGAAGNTPVATPTYPAAIPGVYAVTALGQPGQLASYANYWPGDGMALPGTSIVYFRNQAYGVQGTSTATAYASGVFAGTMSSTGASSLQVIGAMQTKFPVPTIKY
jgi:hypothetical protein